MGVVVPKLKVGDIVIMGNFGSLKGRAVRRAIVAPAHSGADTLARSEPDPATLCKAQTMAQEGERHALAFPIRHAGGALPRSSRG